MSHQESYINITNAGERELKLIVNSGVVRCYRDPLVRVPYNVLCKW